MKKIFKNNRRLLILLAIFLVVAGSALIFVKYYQKNLPVGAATNYPYQVETTNETGINDLLLNDIKNHVNIVYDALLSRLKYVQPAISKVVILSEDQMNIIAKNIGSEAGSINGLYDPNKQWVVLSKTIFEGSLNNSHTVISHEMIHSCAKDKHTDKILLEEGINDYLAGKYFYGPKGGYQDEVRVVNQLMETFKNLGDINPDDSLQKILFEEGLKSGIDNRLNKYLPAGKTSTFAYLNSLLNDKNYDEAIKWLQGVQPAAATSTPTPTTSPTATPDTTTPTDTSSPEKATATATSLNIADLGTITFWPTKVNNLGELITVIINWLLGLMGAAAVVAVVYSGIMYITASADPTKAETAKKNLTWAIIGIVLVALSFVIVQIVANVVGGK